jgi:4-oxalocrotonate tautomerase
MPIVRVELFEGRTPDQKRAFAAATTRAACETLGCAPEDVEVLFFDIRRHDWAMAGRLVSDPKD